MCFKAKIDEVSPRSDVRILQKPIYKHNAIPRDLKNNEVSSYQVQAGNMFLSLQLVSRWAEDYSNEMCSLTSGEDHWPPATALARPHKSV